MRVEAERSLSVAHLLGREPAKQKRKGYFRNAGTSINRPTQAVAQSIMGLFAFSSSFFKKEKRKLPPRPAFQARSTPREAVCVKEYSRERERERDRG